MRFATRKTRGFTLVELLVVIAIIAIIAGLVVPALFNAQDEAYKLQCANNLKGLQTAAFSYSNKKSKFPVGSMKDAPAHESLNVLLKSSSGQDLKPEVFKCPQGEAVEAVVNEDREPSDPPFILEAENLSYMWVKKPTRSSRAIPLTCDKWVADREYNDGLTHAGHRNTLILYDTGGSRHDIDVIDEESRNKFKLDDDLVPEGLTR